MRKQTLILLLCCLVFNTWAQGYSDFMESFMDAQVTPSPGSNGTGSTVDLNGSSTISSNSSRTCTEKDQTDVPVELLLALLYEKGSTYEVKHEPKDGSLYLNIPKMRGNCNDMFRWTVDESISKSGEKEYYVRAVFKQLDRYDILDKDYKVTQKIYKGNLDGFQKCLTESFAKSEPAIYHNSKVKLSDDVDETGKVYLASNGPVGSVIGNHGDVECMKVSNFKPDEDGVVVLSREDDKKMEEHKYAQAICNKKDYREINKHIHEFTIFRDLLVKARDELLIKEYKGLAEKIE